MYYMLLQKGKKKSGGAAGAGIAGTVAGSVGTGAGTASGSAGTARTVSESAGTVGRGAASKKTKVVVVPTVEKAMTRIAVKKQKKQ